MKKIVLCAMALLPLATLAQKPFTIEGNIKGLKSGDKIYLVYGAGKKPVTDSAIVTNGSFAFKGALTEPASANLLLNKNLFVKYPAKGEVIDRLTFFVEPANIKITGTDSLKKADITGSLINDDDKKLKALTKPVDDKIQAISDGFEKLTREQQKDPKLREAAVERYKKATGELVPVLLAYAANYPKSYISLNAINQVVTELDQALAAEKAFAGLAPELKATPTAEKITQILEAAKKTAIGITAMDFTQNDVNGKPVKLSDFKGKYVLIDFWASWCRPCRGENPNVVAAYHKFKDKGFTVLGVSLDGGKTNTAKAREDWLKAIKTDQLTWTQVSDLKGPDSEVVKMYGIRSIPTNFLINPEGKIVAKDLRGQALQDKLQELLGNQSK